MNHFDQPQPEPVELTSDQIEVTIGFDIEQTKLIQEQNYGLDLMIQAAEEELKKLASKN